MSVLKCLPGLVFFFNSATILKAQEHPKLDAFFKKMAETRQFSGNVLVAENGKVVFRGSYGYADFVTHQPNRADISFPIASISKTITATAVLQLAEKGKLTVNDPVSRHLSGFPYAVTIRQLLSHTSGLPPYNAFFKSALAKDPKRIFTNTDFLPAVMQEKPALIYEPGSSGNYDNVNYLVLALIIEKLSGKSYPAYIQEHILKPAGMTHTRFMPLSDQFNTDTLRHYAFPHLYRGLFDEAPVRSNTIPYVRDYWRTFAVVGFGEYISTVDDLLRYDQALYENRLLKPQTLKQSFDVVRLNDGKPQPQLFGLGWEIEADSSHGKAVYHSGAATGLSSVLIRNIDKHQTVILFDNCHFNAHETGDLAMKILNGESIPLPKYSIAREYGIALQKNGADAARTLLKELMRDTVRYQLSESEMNQLGYDFLGTSNPYHMPERQLYAQALETFQLNTEFFPASWNAYDSYGEALLKAGQADKAAEMYKRSIELNPDNKGGKKALEEILEKKKNGNR
ncbi:serine hydrolase [Sediminibacterium ginsengisoli]|nr:serine hydrolase [Sediminibacterium ginsengisoli]